MTHFSEHMDNLAQNEASLQDKTRENSSDMQLELIEYEKLPRLRAEKQIMEFWENQEKFPMLKKIAADILSVPVTEVSVERMFSHLSFILNRYRSTLKADLLEDILFLRLNKKFNETA